MANRKAAGDPSLESQVNEIDETLRRLNDFNDSLVEMSFTIGLRAHKNYASLLRTYITSILNAQSQMGHLEFEESSLAVFDCYLETIPWFQGANINHKCLLSSNAIHFVPLFQKDTGDQRSIITYQTRYGGMFSIDPVSDQLANYNWLVSGTSGSGKSFFVNSILSQSMSLDPNIFIVDIGGSYRKLTQFLGGDIIGIDAQKGFELGPFFIEKSKDEFEERRRQEHIQIIFWEMLREGGQLPSAEEKALIQKALAPLFNEATLPEHPISAVRDALKQEKSEKAKRLRILLDRWCYPSFYGEFLDHPEPVKNKSRILNFDLKGISEFEDLSRVLQIIICSSLWNRVTHEKKHFTYIVLDEVAFSLLKSQPLFVDELVSTLRKYNAGVILVVQDLEKITSNSAGASILQNTQIKAILQQRGDPRNYEIPLDLHPQDINAILSLERRKGSFSDIFLIIDNRRAVLRYAPTTLEYFLATSSAADNRMIGERLSALTGSYQERMLKMLKESLR